MAVQAMEGATFVRHRAGKQREKICETADPPSLHRFGCFVHPYVPSKIPHPHQPKIFPKMAFLGL